MTEIIIPPPELIETSKLTVHKEHVNPNKMTREQLDRLKTSIKKFGFLVPIITNKDLVIADGEQRWIVANELAMPQVLIVRVPVEEVDRLLIQQVMNSQVVRGMHDRDLDALAFENIIQLGAEKDLKYLLNLSDDKLAGYLKDEEAIGYTKKYQIAIDCDDEIQQDAFYIKLTGEGYKCHPLTL